MLSGLPDNYKGMALANLDDSKFKSSEIKEILLSEYDRKAAKGTSGTGKQKEAHHQTKKAVHQNSKSRKEERKCLKCGKQGHIIKNYKMSNTRVNYKNNVRKHKDTFLLEINNTQLDDCWLIDSDATHHVCKHKNLFKNYRQITNETIYSADNHTEGNLETIGISDIEIETYVNNNVFSLTLQEVYYVPNIRRNLLPVSQIERKGKRLIFESGKIKIFNKRTRMIVGEAFNKNGLDIINAENITGKSSQAQTYIIGDTKMDEK